MHPFGSREIRSTAESCVITGLRVREQEQAASRDRCQAGCKVVPLPAARDDHDTRDSNRALAVVAAEEHSGRLRNVPWPVSRFQLSQLYTTSMFGCNLDKSTEAQAGGPKAVVAGPSRWRTRHDTVPLHGKKRSWGLRLHMCGTERNRSAEEEKVPLSIFGNELH
jgi:hypothetical protein